MVELGYVEGKNITYIYHGVLDPDPQVIEREVKRLLDQKVDLFLTLGTRAGPGGEESSGGYGHSRSLGPSH